MRGHHPVLVAHRQIRDDHFVHAAKIRLSLQIIIMLCDNIAHERDKNGYIWQTGIPLMPLARLLLKGIVTTEAIR